VDDSDESQERILSASHGPNCGIDVEEKDDENKLTEKKYSLHEI